MKTTIQLQAALISVLSLSVVSGCKPGAALAPREKVVAAVQRDHAPENDTLYNVKFFLWPVGASGETIRDAINIANEIDRLDKIGFDQSREVERLRTALKPLQDAETQLTSLQRQGNQLPRQITAKRNSITTIQNAITSLQTQIFGLQEQLAVELGRAPAEQNADLIASLNSQIASKQTQLTTKQTQLANEQAVLALLLQQQADNPGLVAQAQARVGALTTDLDADGSRRRRLNDQLPIEQAAVKDQGDQQVARITQLVYWYKNQPSRVALRFEQGLPQVIINEWALYSEGEPQVDKRDFSSEDGSITNVSYQVKGGVWRFDLGVFEQDSPLTAAQKAQAITDAKNGQWSSALKEVYSFRFGRTSYAKTEDPNDGRKFFGGEMTRYRDPNGPFCTGSERTELSCKRQGSVKLVDRNN